MKLIESRYSTHFFDTQFELWIKGTMYLFIARNKNNIEQKSFLDKEEAYDYYNMMV